MSYKYKVISLHFTTDCNLNCPMCYRPRTSKNQKPFKFFMDLIPYLSELSPQVALGGGEPFMHPEFVRDFSKACKKSDLLCNVTTNGTLPMKDYIKDVEMVSVSYDKYKFNGMHLGIRSLIEYKKRVSQLKGKTRIGCNYLVSEWDIRDPRTFLLTLDLLFNWVERVFALYPKNWKAPDILKFRAIYYAPTFKWKHFYVDDCTNMILTEKSYSGWKHPCHWGRSLISIDEQGKVYGCSFDPKPILTLKKPEDIMKLKDMKLEKRYECPYIKTPK